MIYYVDINAGRGGDGSRERPFRRINDAARIAMPGDTVLVAPGVYREYVNPVHAGTENARITYRSTKYRGAVITGAEEVKGWKKVQGSVWTAEVDNGVFGGYNPYTTEVYGDWYFAKNHLHTGSVYLNDRMMYEADSLEDCFKGEEKPESWEPQYSVYQWFSEQKDGKTVLYANFQGKDPNRENVEMNVRRECFMPQETGVSYITVSGFVICKAATTWAPPAAYQDGMIGPHWSKGWIIEDCEIYGSRCGGISLGRYYDPENDNYFTTKHVKSPTQMERDAVCRGQYHGWLKEKVGSHIIRRCTIHDCGQDGIVGRMGGVFSLIEDNEIHHINNMKDLGGAEIAGIKLHAAIDVVMRRNHIHHCPIGIWCDWEAQGTRITQNLLHDNMAPEGTKNGETGEDIFVEVGHGPTLIDNNILLSKMPLLMATEGIGFVHNLCCGPLGFINAGVDSVVNGKNEPRYTPYHIRHRTEVAGFMTILHGDDRFYNNIFIQKWPVSYYEEAAKHCYGVDNAVTGTRCLDIFPTWDEWIAQFDMDSPRPDMGKLAAAHFGHLPVWVNGNAYFNGAQAFGKEQKNYLFDGSVKAEVDFAEENGVYRLKTNLFEYLKDCSDGIITSDILGKAFEPEQRFENPDGTEIIFNRDYFDNHRGTSTIPGPFADPEAAEAPVWKEPAGESDR
ncbi:MAG: right-handed parallel beta-helix repeat-containing protein [Lachnospiraceae bacterium]|jgi:alpha-N-arabinofuranosidase